MDDLIKLYKSLGDTKLAMRFRRKLFDKLANSCTLKKVAFDTRRVDQKNTYIPRNSLQHYHRSEDFVTNAMMDKIKSFGRLKNLLDNLKMKFGSMDEWHNSYCRFLLNSLDNALRTFQKDGDYTFNQPGVGNFAYLDQLLYARYRLDSNNLTVLTDNQIIEALTKKDGFINNFIPHNLETISSEKNDVLKQSEQIIKPNHNYDSIIGKMFEDVKASKDNPDIERSVVITVKEKINGNG